MSELATAVKDDLIRYFRHLGARVERAARSLPPDKFWVKPFAFGNSVGHLILHLTGNLNHYIGAQIASTGYVRNRPLEFSDPTQHSPAQVLARFQEAIELVARTIKLLDDAALVLPVTDYDPIQTRFGLLLVCASHLNNHVGQMAYLVQAHGHSTNEPPVW
jgi:uncharacterized damage-inducible protein DinB